VSLDDLDTRTVAEELLLSSCYTSQKRRVADQVREREQLMIAGGEELQMALDLAEATEGGALAEIAELEPVLAAKIKELAAAEKRLQEFDDDLVAVGADFQLELTKLREDAKLELEATRRVIQQEQMKVMAMQEDVARTRRSRLLEEKDARATHSTETISLDASTRKYVFPPIATMSTLSRSPKDTAFDAFASGTDKLSLSTSYKSALGKKKMKYLAEVYVPQALQHLDDKNKGAFSKTGSLPKLPQGPKDLSKSLGAKPSGKDMKPGDGMFMESM
jgi:hypothetical protein